MAAVRQRGTLGTSIPLICNYIAMKSRNYGDSLWIRPAAMLRSSNCDARNPPQLDSCLRIFIKTVGEQPQQQRACSALTETTQYAKMAQYSRGGVLSSSCSEAIYCLAACSEFRCSLECARKQEAADGTTDGCRPQ